MLVCRLSKPLSIAFLISILLLGICFLGEVIEGAFMG